MKFHTFPNTCYHFRSLENGIIEVSFWFRFETLWQTWWTAGQFKRYMNILTCIKFSIFWMYIEFIHEKFQSVDFMWWVYTFSMHMISKWIVVESSQCQIVPWSTCKSKPIHIQKFLGNWEICMSRNQNKFFVTSLALIW